MIETSPEVEDLLSAQAAVVATFAADELPDLKLIERAGLSLTESEPLMALVSMWGPTLPTLKARMAPEDLKHRWIGRRFRPLTAHGRTRRRLQALHALQGEMTEAVVKAVAASPPREPRESAAVVSSRVS
jgi:hypothetical protein